MFTCRSFSRVNCIWNYANALYVVPRPVNYIQGNIQSHELSCTWKMGGSNDAVHGVERKRKRGKVKSAWRPISSQSPHGTGKSMWRPISTQTPAPEGTVKSVLRPVSTQSNSNEGFSETDVKAYQVKDCHEKSYVPDQVEVECLKMSSCVDTICSTGDTGLISEQVESLTLTSLAVPSNDQSEALEQKCVLSVNKVDDLYQSQCKEYEIDSSQTLDEEVNETSRHELDIAVCKVDGADKYSTAVEVEASLIRFIKGKGGGTQKQIEDDCGVELTLPSSKGESTIVIEGASAEKVTKASDKIKVVLEEAVKSPRLDYSHFISLPLAIHEGLVQKLIDFQNSILGNSEPMQDDNVDSDFSEDGSENEDGDKQADKCPTVVVNLRVLDDDRVKIKLDSSLRENISVMEASSSVAPDIAAKLGIDKSIFIKPKTFHLTVLMLKLWNKERIAAATGVLQSVLSKVMDALDGRPVFIRLKGLELMKGSQSKARVLYAPVEEIGEEGRLLRACQVIIEAYIDAGLVLERDAQQKLRLHATLMNARHRKSKKRVKRHDSFDARGIYKQYGSMDWGKYLIREAHLSQRFAFDDNGYYHCCTSIPFPDDLISTNM